MEEECSFGTDDGWNVRVNARQQAFDVRHVQKIVYNKLVGLGGRYALVQQL